jgi:hypothetical protein
MPSIKTLAREIDGLVDTVTMRAALTTIHTHTEVAPQKGRSSETRSGRRTE